MFQQVLKCDICDKTFSGPAPHQQHLASEKHRKKVGNAKYYQALTFNSSSCAVGITAAENCSKTSSPNVESASHAISYIPVFNCDLCNAVCNTQEQFDCHAAGQKHQKKLNQIILEAGCPGVGEAMGEIMRCELCNIICSGIVPYRMHCEGALHQKNVKRMESVQYRCDACQITLPDSASFRDHLLSGPHHHFRERGSIPMENVTDSTSAVPKFNSSDSGKDIDSSHDPAFLYDCMVKLKDLELTVIEPDVVVHFV